MVAETTRALVVPSARIGPYVCVARPKFANQTDPLIAAVRARATRRYGRRPSEWNDAQMKAYGRCIWLPEIADVRSSPVGRRTS
jgi:hypothetical protein